MARFGPCPSKFAILWEIPSLRSTPKIDNTDLQLFLGLFLSSSHSPPVVRRRVLLLQWSQFNASFEPSTPPFWILYPPRLPKRPISLSFKEGLLKVKELESAPDPSPKNCSSAMCWELASASQYPQTTPLRSKVNRTPAFELLGALPWGGCR